MRYSLAWWANVWGGVCAIFVLKWFIEVDIDVWRCVYCAAIAFAILAAILYYKDHDDKTLR